MREGKRARPVSMYGIGSSLPEGKKKCNIKLHYADVVNVAERLTKKLWRSSGSYDVQRKHKFIMQDRKPSDSWVTVHNLRQLDGGILDPDDKLRDVADDREQIIATFTESKEAHQGDGTSASDQSEAPSPDIFKNAKHSFEPFSCNGIEITGEELNATPPPLHVRRGSEPALNRISPIQTIPCPPDPSKRWSTAPVIDDDGPPSSTPLKDKNDSILYDDYPGERGEGSGEEKHTSSATSSGSSHHSATTKRFNRDVNRCSIQILSDNPNMMRWAEAADRVAFGHSEGIRREPVGGSLTPTGSRQSSVIRSRPPSANDYRRQLVSLVNDRTPLGIHVVPWTDKKNNNDFGLLVEGIDRDGRVARDGRISVQDVIIEINGRSLYNVTFHKAQEIFRDAMATPELRLLLKKDSQQDNLVETHERMVTGMSKVANVTSTSKIPAASVSSRAQSVILQSNTRKIGRKIHVSLLKGSHGLGFSITTRDNPAGGEAPIYIKNILPKGAAIEEGTLKIGDRLLEVNGVEITGFSQSDVANLLRQISAGSKVDLTISRQERPQTIIGNVSYESEKDRNSDSPKLPRQLHTEKSPEDNSIYSIKQKEILTLEIPVHDSERAGLGVSVKGKTSNNSANGCIDLGIFVKNVIHGGAASKDGRLKQNDQLVSINGISLLGKSNGEAMKTLRTAMHQEGPNPGMITLSIARRLDARSGRDSANSLGTFTSGTETLTLGGKGGYTTPTMDQKPNDSSVFYSNKNLPYENQDDSISSNQTVRQRMIDLNNVALRNESYYRATHDTWISSEANNSHFYDRQGNDQTDFQRQGSAFKVPRRQESFKEEYNVRDKIRQFENSPRKSSVSSVRAYSDQPSQGSDVYISQSSLEEGAGFSRDQLGRQSISEKRHATLDAKNTDTYQRSKKAREEREKSKNSAVNYQASRNQALLRRSPTPAGPIPRASSEESLHKHSPTNLPYLLDRDVHVKEDFQQRRQKEIGPGLGMRKSSSLESLQTMVQEMTLEEEGKRAGVKVPRGRGCNESFRAAVDRSYDAPLSNAQMETESESSGSGFGRNSRQSSVNSTLDKKKNLSKRQGLLKGLGTMFRFGKHRKSSEAESSLRRQEEREIMQQHYQKMMENRQNVPFQGNMETKISSSTLNDEEGNVSRSERMHQLRAEHQKRHVERNRIYPTDDSEERYDQVMKQRMEPVPPEPKAEIHHIRSQSMEPHFYRHSNRMPFQDPNTFSHYVNYEQIQMHMRKNKEQERLTKLANQQYQDFRDKQTSREQRNYQSQRSREPYQQRPVSNYFEYESVQAVMSHAQNMSSLPRVRNPPPPPAAVNRNVQPPKGHIVNVNQQSQYRHGNIPPPLERNYNAPSYHPQYNQYKKNTIPGSKV